MRIVSKQQYDQHYASQYGIETSVTKDGKIFPAYEKQYSGWKRAGIIAKAVLESLPLFTLLFKNVREDIYAAFHGKKILVIQEDSLKDLGTKTLQRGKTSLENNTSNKSASKEVSDSTTKKVVTPENDKADKREKEAEQIRNQLLSTYKGYIERTKEPLDPNTLENIQKLKKEELEAVNLTLSQLLVNIKGVKDMAVQDASPVMMGTTDKYTIVYEKGLIEISFQEKAFTYKSTTSGLTEFKKIEGFPLLQCAYEKVSQEFPGAVSWKDSEPFHILIFDSDTLEKVEKAKSDRIRNQFLSDYNDAGKRISIAPRLSVIEYINNLTETDLKFLNALISDLMKNFQILKQKKLDQNAADKLEHQNARYYISCNNDRTFEILFLKPALRYKLKGDTSFKYLNNFPLIECVYAQLSKDPSNTVSVLASTSNQSSSSILYEPLSAN